MNSRFTYFFSYIPVKKIEAADNPNIYSSIIKACSLRCRTFIYIYVNVLDIVHHLFMYQEEEEIPIVETQKVIVRTFFVLVAG